jgi:hypothetical protein
VDLAGAWLVTIGHVRDLDVGNVRQVPFDRPRQIALHDLGVIDVVL